MCSYSSNWRVLNVKINCSDCDDKEFVKDILKKGQKLVDETCKLEEKILAITNSKIK